MVGWGMGCPVMGVMADDGGMGTGYCLKVPCTQVPCVHVTVCKNCKNRPAVSFWYKNTHSSACMTGLEILSSSFLPRSSHPA